MSECDCLKCPHSSTGYNPSHRLTTICKRAFTPWGSERIVKQFNRRDYGREEPRIRSVKPPAWCPLRASQPAQGGGQ